MHTYIPLSDGAGVGTVFVEWRGGRLVDEAGLRLGKPFAAGFDRQGTGKRVHVPKGGASDGKVGSAGMEAWRGQQRVGALDVKTFMKEQTRGAHFQAFESDFTMVLGGRCLGSGQTLTRRAKRCRNLPR